MLIVYDWFYLICFSCSVIQECRKTINKTEAICIVDLHLLAVLILLITELTIESRLFHKNGIIQCKMIRTHTTKKIRNLVIINTLMKFWREIEFLRSRSCAMSAWFIRRSVLYNTFIAIIIVFDPPKYKLK